MEYFPLSEKDSKDPGHHSVVAVIRLACILKRDDYYLTIRILVKNLLSNLNSHRKSKHGSCK